MNVIETKKLTKYYGKSRGIIDVTLSVKKGEIFGFIGPNGAGKSTLIRTLLELIHSTSGEASIFGKDINKYSKEILMEVGYLPSEVFYYDDMRVIDLLKYSASFYKKDCTKRINELSKILDLDLHKKINELSYGNKKKVGIVQALIHEPKLLILDEPTSGLDPLIQQKFFDLLRKEKENGVTIFFSSHVLNEVQKICDRVAIIKEGKIIRLEEIKNINEDNYKKIKLEVKKQLKDNYFNLEGISNLSIKNTAISFIYRGDINNILKLISNLEVENIWIEEPDLEEIFLHYYNKED